jgi:hypothetical protein
VLAGLVVYMFGYPAVQVSNDDSPAALRLLSSARQDLAASGFDKSLAAIEPMPDRYYLASDVLGLIHQNYATLQQRLANYPAFLTTGERSEFKEMATDTELQNLLQTRGSVVDLLKHPRIVGVINNAEIMGELEQLDLKDLYQYLKTGRSAKYSEERILGWWQLDAYATYIAARKKNPDMPPKQMAELKQMLMIWIPELKFLASPDKKMTLRLELGEAARQFIEQARKAAEAAAQAAQAAQETSAPTALMDPRMAARYGLRRPQASAEEGEATETPKPAANAAVPGMPKFNLTGDGSWQRQGARYRISFKDGDGKEHAAEAMLDDDRLLLISQGQTLIFYKLFVEG